MVSVAVDVVVDYVSYIFTIFKIFSTLQLFSKDTGVSNKINIYNVVSRPDG